jgi:hypothetical protein
MQHRIVWENITSGEKKLFGWNEKTINLKALPRHGETGKPSTTSIRKIGNSNWHTD